METAGIHLPDGKGSAIAPVPERRHCVRHKVHTPAYVSLDENTSGVVLDLSEVLNINEDGISIQTSSPLHLNQRLRLCLDLSETNTYIHTTGEVVWLDRSGRAGIRFEDLNIGSVGQLKLWLVANSAAAYGNKEDQPAGAEHGGETGADNDADTAFAADASSIPDHTSVLSALEAVQREVESLGANLDAALQLVADRAQRFVHASGAAIALSRGDDMVCCASAGDAPPIGSHLYVGAGFSGECVRTGKLLRCDDADFDPIVDRESCRVLGIRSMAAVPVLFGDNVVGLLEVFSPSAYAFCDADNTTLERLADLVFSAVTQASRPPQTEVAPKQVAENETPVGEDAIPRHTSTVFRVLIIAAVAALGVVLTWTFAPSSRSHANNTTPAATQQPAPPAPAKTEIMTFEGLSRLAQRGDPVAQFALGARYATGEDVKQDYAQAVRWFSRAAEQGHVVSQATLGAYYWAGRGVPVDLNKAYFWSVLAQAGGDEASKYRVAVLTSRMSRSQVLAAQEQANAWIRQHQNETTSTLAR